MYFILRGEDRRFRLRIPKPGNNVKRVRLFKSKAERGRTRWRSDNSLVPLNNSLPRLKLFQRISPIHRPHLSSPLRKVYRSRPPAFLGFIRSEMRMIPVNKKDRKRRRG